MKLVSGVSCRLDRCDGYKHYWYRFEHLTMLSSHITAVNRRRLRWLPPVWVMSRKFKSCTDFNFNFVSDFSWMRKSNHEKKMQRSELSQSTSMRKIEKRRKLLFATSTLFQFHERARLWGSNDIPFTSHTWADFASYVSICEMNQFRFCFCFKSSKNIRCRN